MPYRRRSYRRRTRRRRSALPWYKRKYNAMQLAAKAASGVYYLKGLVNSEMFHKDISVTLGAAQSKITHLTAIGNGDGIDTRSGNSILLKSFVANGYMYIDADQTTNTRVMLALVQDTQQVSDTAPSLTDIFMSSTSPHTLLSNANLGRFKIIWRRQYTLSSNAAGDNAKQIKIYKSFNTHIRYNGGNDTDVQRNGLYFCIITSESSEFPTVDLNTRISYHDN